MNIFKNGSVSQLLIYVYLVHALWHKYSKNVKEQIQLGGLTAFVQILKTCYVNILFSVLDLHVSSV